jgi:hypothetical protein
MIVDEPPNKAELDSTETIEELDSTEIIEEIVADSIVDEYTGEEEEVMVDTAEYADYEYEEESLFTAWPDYVFFHIENSQGYLDKYWVVDPQPNFAYIFKGLNNSQEPAEADENSPFVISKADYARPFTLRVYYKGEVKSYIVK